MLMMCRHCIEPIQSAPSQGGIGNLVKDAFLNPLSYCLTGGLAIVSMNLKVYVSVIRELPAAVIDLILLYLLAD